MPVESPNNASWRFAPRLTQLLAVGWVTIITVLFLTRYHGWSLPVTLAMYAHGILATFAIGPAFGEFWRMALTDAGCVAAIAFTAFGAGAVAVHRLTPEKNLWSTLLALAAGLWILSVAVLAVGWFSTAWLPLVLLLAGCWLLPAPRRFLAHGWRFKPARLDGWEIFLLACLVLAAVLGLPGALVPTFDYDGLEYHLGAPAEYLKAGRIIALPHNFYSNLPQLTEMLYMLALKLSSDSAAKLLHWGFGLGTAATVYAMAARWGTRRTGLTAAALFYCLPYVENLGKQANIDLATAFFASLAFGASLFWLEQNAAGGGNAIAFERHGLWLAALAAGAAVATKWTAVAAVLLPLAIFLAGKTRSLRTLTVFGLLAAVPVLPWLAKNWLLMHNPVYPLLNHWFSNPHWSPEQTVVFAQKHYASFGAEGWKQFGTLIGQYSFGEIEALPLLLMTAPLILLLKNAKREARQAGILFVLAYGSWFLLTFRPWRFLFPAFGLAAIAGAVAVEALTRPTRMVTGVVLLFGLIVRGISCCADMEGKDRLPAQVSFVNCALGQVSRQEFLARVSEETFEPILWMNAHLPDTAMVLYVGEARTFYSRHRVLWSSAFDRHLLDALARPPADPRQLLQTLRAKGVTHVYVNFPEWDRLRSHYGYLKDIDEDAFRPLLQEHARKVHVTDQSAVWELE